MRVNLRLADFFRISIRDRKICRACTCNGTSGMQPTTLCKVHSNRVVDCTVAI